jgi:hypothetical protein
MYADHCKSGFGGPVTPLLRVVGNARKAERQNPLYLTFLLNFGDEMRRRVRVARFADGTRPSETDRRSAFNTETFYIPANRARLWSRCLAL